MASAPPVPPTPRTPARRDVAKVARMRFPEHAVPLEDTQWAAREPARDDRPVDRVAVHRRTTLPADEWTELSARHAERSDELTAGHRARRATGERHAIEDFLYEYYNTRPSLLRRWHPGVGIGLEPSAGGPAPHAAWRWYTTDAEGVVTLDVSAYLADRGDTVRFIHGLLSATASRPAFTGCFGLHEWAMAYRTHDHRHPLPLRLGEDGTDAVVEGHQIRCTHFDAFRFFTPAAVGRNRLQPTRDSQVELEQPGCLHTSMDCHKWAGKLGGVVPGTLALDTFQLAKDARWLDMQASPYDLSAHHEAPVAIETPEGKGTYVKRQRGLTERAEVLRSALIAVCQDLLRGTPEPASTEFR